jgi:hypothetical protein
VRTRNGSPFSWFSLFLPTLMLSGFIFPIASMPTFLRG